MMKNNISLMLTQYEKYGTVGTEEYLQYFIDEELDLNESDIAAYNDYLRKNGYETYYDDLDEMLCGFQPTEAARATFYGDFNFGREFHKFNGYGNIDSFEGWQVVKEMRSDDDFLKWYVEYNNLIDLESQEVLEAINEANELIKAGY